MNWHINRASDNEAGNRSISRQLRQERAAKAREQREISRSISAYEAECIDIINAAAAGDESAIVSADNRLLAVPGFTSDELRVRAGEIRRSRRT